MESPFSVFFIMLLLIFNFGILISVFGGLFEICFYSSKKNNRKDIRPAINGKHILSIFLIFLLLSFATYSLALFTGLLFRVASPVKTGEFGNIFLAWDKAIFTTDPGIWLINKFNGTVFENILLWVYNSLFVVLSFMLLISFLFNKKVFRKLVLSFFISWIIARPLWFLFPTLSPDLMFRKNDLKMAGSQEAKVFNNFDPSLQLKENLQSQEQIHTINLNPNERYLPTSTFPSMHASWGAIIAYAGIILSPWLGIFLVPWAILNGVSAVYILEHFAVDIFFGTFIALLSIAITEILLRFENKYFEDKFGLFLGFDYVRTVLKKFADDVGILK
ncbi:MAG: phosphatase PAP2 family protein [Candidatus Staskawiczbacteria bacterium]